MGAWDASASANAPASPPSRRPFARLFQRGTRPSFWQCRQRACVPRSLRHLAAGMRMPVTRIATPLGYDNPAAYTAVFEKLLGRPPTAFRTPASRVPDDSLTAPDGWRVPSRPRW
ncbi:helix-turn-helix domain-containing protein [Streptomyces sp. NPDC052721]|uniref:helix-turn-helix domain-containing protein n=1 Tax=Streptomyces sp. NPDC052721 TaxID=3154955 RepID=UPI00342F27FC